MRNVWVELEAACARDLEKGSICIKVRCMMIGLRGEWHSVLMSVDSLEELGS